MGWRETLTGAVSDSMSIDKTDKTDKTPLFVNSVNSVNAPESGNLPKAQTQWVRLSEERRKVVQVAPLTEPGAGRGSKGGVREASRELGIDRYKVRRAVKIAEARTQAGLRTALSEACEGLPLSLDQMVQGFGAEGESDWLEGYEPHCRPEFLRAFAETVAARLARAEPEPPTQSPQNTQNRKPEPNPLEGLALLREDWNLIESRTRGRRNRESLLAEYARRWKEAAEAQPVEHRKANAGRFAANTWLRGVRP